MNINLGNFTDVLADEIGNSQPMSLSPSAGSKTTSLHIYNSNIADTETIKRPPKGTGQQGQFRSTEEIDLKYRDVFSYPYFNLVQSSVIEDALYSDKSMVVCAPTGSGKTVVFEMAIVQLLMELEQKQNNEDFKIIYMAPVKALCTERLTEWYSKFTKLGLLCIEVTGDTDVDFTQLKPYKIIITTPEKWDMLTRRWRDHRGLVEVIKLFLIDEVHILNDELRGPVLEAVVSRMKTIENSAQSVYRIEKLQKEIKGEAVSNKSAPRIRFVAVSATVSNPEDVADWLGTSDKPAVFYKFGDECRPVKLKRVVEGYPCPEGTSIFKFDIILNYKLWPVIQKYHSGKPTLIFCNTRKSVVLTAETLSRELTISFNADQKAKLTAVASSIKNKKLQALIMNGVGCHHAGLLYEERQNIELAFRNRDLPILITTTTLAMGVNLPAHLVIVKNTQQYVNGAYQEYSISTVLQMVGRAGRPQFDTEATAVIMTRLADKPRYQALVGGCEPLQSYLHKRLAENLNSEAALGTVGDVAQCVQWLRSTFLYVRAARDPKKYLGLPQNSPQHLISKKIEELCVKAMNGLASSGLITMDEASCIESTEAGRLMSIFYLDLETMKHIMKIEGTESLERLLALICESHELADMHLRVDERRCLNTLNRNNAAATIRFPMKGKINTRQMKLNCIIQAVLGCLTIPDPSLNQEAMKIMRIADRICKCLVTYVTRPDLISYQPQFYSAVLNTIILAKCVAAHLWENSQFVSKQLKGIGPTFSTLLASAGKVNFMLLEESHPRDLERIMNKGAPAGNILRKQVSLLPKYQLTMIPVDERTVTVQLLLANQCHLVENMENLTAGDNHKSYIIVGDSNNHLLLLIAFKDKDLISVFDGTITHQVRRKVNVEHKIFAHCISSTFVGIDVQSEYLFNDLNQYFGGEVPSKKTTERQTCITETFKERKRKNTDAIDKTQSKEKKKRDNAIIEHFKFLKESFKAASKNVNQKGEQQNYKNEFINSKEHEYSFTTLPSDTRSTLPCVINTQTIRNSLVNEDKNIQEIDSDEFIDDEKIDSILNEIENQMCKSNTNSKVNIKPSSSNSNFYVREEDIQSPRPFQLKSDSDIKNTTSENLIAKCNLKTASGSRKRRLPIMPKSNYNFIDLLERDLSINEDDDKTNVPQKHTGFSDAIKTQIQKYIAKTKNKTKESDGNIGILLNEAEVQQLNDDEKNNECQTTNHTSSPLYEIKEILGGTKVIQQNNNIHHTQTKQALNFNYNEDQIKEDKIINTFHVDKLSLPNTQTAIFSGENASTGTLRKQTEDRANKLEAVVIDDRGTSQDMHRYEENDKRNSNKCNNTITNMKGEDNGYTRNYNNECPAENVDKLHTDISSKNPNKCYKITTFSDMPSTHFNRNRVNDTLRGSSIPINTKEFSNMHEYNNKDHLAMIPGKEIISFDETKDMKRIVNFNQPYSNTSDCTSSKANHVYSSTNFINGDQNRKDSSNFLKQIDTYQQKAEYVKRYTYSTSKIDVCTKQTSEYCVQVIKKVKMDLDITAIVSRKHNSFQNNCKESENCEVNRNKATNIYIPIPKPENTSQHTNQDSYKFINNATDEIQSTPKVILQPALTFPKAELLPVNKLTNKVMVPESNAISNLKVFNRIAKVTATSNYNVPENQSRNNIDEVESPDVLHKDIKEHDILGFDSLNISGHLGETDSEDTTTNKDCKIKNILQKYSKILGQNITQTGTLSAGGIHKNVNCTKSPSINSKSKPFKISDINKLNATLPNSIINTTPKAKNSAGFLKMNDSVETQDNHERQNQHEVFNDTEYTKWIEMRSTDEAVPEYQNITDLDLEPIHLPANVELETSHDFRLDQSMFDPKTLLQCVVDDDSDEIVPPPPEFCDGFSYSPDYNAAEVAFTNYNVSQCSRDAQIDISTERYPECNECIFDDHCPTELTPSKEIETWNLSREHSWEYEPHNSVNISPGKSYTVMHKNIRNDFILPNSQCSRKIKLGKFRVSQKNKLKIKK